MLARSACACLCLAQHINRIAESYGLQDVQLSMSETLSAAAAGSAGGKMGFNAWPGARFTPGGFAGNGSGSGRMGSGGSSKNPLLISMADPSIKDQVWKTVRTLMMAYLLLLLLEEDLCRQRVCAEVLVHQYPPVHSRRRPR